MKFWTGVTNNQWFKFLSEGEYDDVNFWQPSGRPPFTTLPEGTPFLFKLKAPNNHIAGGGRFVTYYSMPLLMAWEVFHAGNGAATIDDLQRLIGPDPDGRPPTLRPIGCSVLSEVFFLPRSEWIELKAWPQSAVRGKIYDTDTVEGNALWTAVLERRARSSRLALVAEPAMEWAQEARYGEPYLTRGRIGQKAFSTLVIKAYDQHCAITGEGTFPTLEAVHIQAYSKGGPHRVSNGMLLRSDFHKLFDAGLVTVTPELRVRVSDRIKEQWYNGKAYYRLHDQPLAVIPKLDSQRPDPDFLRWHLTERFVG